MGNINWKNKCWVATAYLVNEVGKVVLTWNKNLQTWIPVGGHIDPGETPEEAIIREVAEETGFDFEFVNPHKEETEYETTHLLRNHKVQIEEVPHHNIHMNFIFYGKCTRWNNKLETDEQEKLRWFSKEELMKEKENFLPNVHNQALEAIDLANRNN